MCHSVRFTSGEDTSDGSHSVASGLAGSEGFRQLVLG